jgi:lipopolysaccharide transport system ATP-binding protein
MSDVAVRVEGLGKQYRIGKGEWYKTLRDTLSDSAFAPFRWVRSLVGSPSGARDTSTNLFWALRDVSFEVPQGAIVGVIGRNGAGKSTLLKVLSRITEPTEGRVEVHGRVGSLLEVGTGFHPELTGRENVFLNGAILGMRRAEISRKFDEIVAFAEVDKFIDTPVKHYSSGMYMRLAFAVAAHLEPDILVVDEVLGVGDSQFQKKCVGKMGDVAKQGRTVLFVSHNLPSVESLCETCVLLRQGRLERVGEPRSIISDYLTRDLPQGTADLSLCGHLNRKPGSKALMTRLRIISDDQQASAVRMGRPLTIEVDFESKTLGLAPVLGIAVKTSNGAPLLAVNNVIAGTDTLTTPASSGTVRATFPDLRLMPGAYLLDLYFDEGHTAVDRILDAAAFEVLPADVYGTGKLSAPSEGPLWAPVSFEILSGESRFAAAALGHSA